MSNFIEDQIIFSDFIKEVGDTYINEIETVNDVLTIGGAPLWKVSSPEMAWRHLVNIAEANCFLEKIKILLRPNYYQFKLKLDLMKYAFSKKSLNLKKKQVSIISLGFSPRMHADVVEPVIKGMQDKNLFSISMICLKEAVDSNIPEGTTRVNFGAYRQKNFSKKKKQYFSALKNAEVKIKKSANIQNLIHKGKPGLSSGIINKLFKLFFEGLAPASLINIIHAQYVFDHVSPVCVISPDTADARCRVFNFLAMGRGVPVYEIQFGLTGPEGIEWRFFHADRVAVWGEQAKRHLVSHGVPNSRIVVTGSPRHDSVVRSFEGVVAKPNIFSAKKKPKILFGSTYTDKAHAKYCPPEIITEMKKAVIKSVQDNSNFDLIIKPHPKENEKELAELISGNYSNVLVSKKSDDIREMILECDAFISFGSTSSLDALLGRKKTGSLVFAGWEFSNELLDGLPIVKLDTVDKVKTFIENTLVGEHVRYKKHELEEIEKICVLDGEASKRISEDICALLQYGKPL